MDSFDRKMKLVRKQRSKRKAKQSKNSYRDIKTIGQATKANNKKQWERLFQMRRWKQGRVSSRSTNAKSLQKKDGQFQIMQEEGTNQNNISIDQKNGENKIVNAKSRWQERGGILKYITANKLIN